MSQPVQAQELSNSDSHDAPSADDISLLVAEELYESEISESAWSDEDPDCSDDEKDAENTDDAVDAADADDAEDADDADDADDAGDAETSDDEKDAENADDAVDVDDAEDAETSDVEKDVEHAENAEEAGEVVEEPFRFSALPFELRLMIWNFTLPGPSLILDRASVAVLYDFREKRVRRHHFEKWSIHPVALRVCRESRREALSSYSVMHSRIDARFTADWPPECPSELNYRGYGRQWINYNTDTLFLPHTRLMDFGPPGKTDCEKVRSLMIASDRFWTFGSGSRADDHTKIDGSWQVGYYDDIISKFPNLRELFICTNWTENCDIPVGEELSFSNKIPVNLSAIGSDDNTDLLVEVDGEESQDLREWVWSAKEYFKEIKQQHPECNFELKFVGGPSVRPWKTYDCGCCQEFDPLGILDFISSRPAPKHRNLAYSRSIRSMLEGLIGSGARE